MIKRDRSVGGWAHDFRTVAASLLNYADVYAVSGCTKEQFIDGVRSNCQWFLELVDGMAEHVNRDNDLTSSTTAAGSASMESLVEAVVDAHRLAVQKSGIRLIVDVDRDLTPPAASQAIILQRILANLLSNAIRHSQGRAVLVRVAHAATSDPTGHENLCVLEVQDFGTGITRQQVKRLMQQDLNLEQPSQGARQRRGLATVRQLVDCLSGKLTVQSQFGKGTRVTVEFVAGQEPVANAEPGRGGSSEACGNGHRVAEKVTEGEETFLHSAHTTAGMTHQSNGELSPSSSPLSMASGRAGRAQPQHGGAPQVLLIDDDPDMRSLISALLTSEGIRTIAVADEQRAMNLELGQFDCVLLDLNLGDVKGSDVAARLRLAGFAKLILALTAEPLAKPGLTEQRYAMQVFDGWIDKTEGGGAVAKRLRQVLFTM